MQGKKNQRKKLSFSICIPIYKGSSVLKETLKSIIEQKFSNYEIILGDDNSTVDKKEINKTKEIIRSFKQKNIRYIKHEKNLGCQQNMQRIVSLAKNDTIYLVAQDDILASNSLQRTRDAFFLDKNIGAITRGYFWFDKHITKPVRIKKPLDENKDMIISINDNPQIIAKVFNTVDNITGLAFRRKYWQTPFHQDMFTTHIHPFAQIFKNHKIVCLKDYSFACRISLSQSRKAFSYIKSPMQSWIDMFTTIFYEKKFDKLRKYLISEFIATNYVGLVQIRNFASFRVFFYEIFLLIKYRPFNLLSPPFWFISLLCFFLPKSILLFLTDLFKNSINIYLLPKIKFNTLAKVT